MVEVIPVRRPLVFRLAGYFLAALLFGFLISLGRWQTQRLAWKEELLASMHDRQNSPAVSLRAMEAMLKQGADIDYRPVKITGMFNNNTEQFFLATLDGQPGFHLYVPLALADGRWILVNRGFVPENLRDASRRKSGLIEGSTTLTGLARKKLDAKPGALLPENDPGKNLFFWKDLDAMARNAGLEPDKVAPFFVDAGPGNPSTWPKGGVTIFDLPNNHLQYALTWYGLAFALAGVMLVFHFRKPSKTKPDQ